MWPDDQYPIIITEKVIKGTPPAQIFQRQNKSQSYKQLTIGGPRCSNSRIADQFLKKQFAESSKEKASI